MLCRVDGRHADGIHRFHATGNCLADTVVNMSLGMDIFNMLVIRTKGKTTDILSGFYNASNNRFQIACRTAFPHMDMHTQTALFHHFVKVRAFMVIGNACKHIGIQLFAGQSRCMSILWHTIEQSKLFRHHGCRRHRADIIHDLTQAENTRIVHILLHLCCIKRTAVVLKRQGWYTGRHHNKYICRYILGFI